jgi:hypothetical protein
MPLTDKQQWALETAEAVRPSLAKYMATGAVPLGLVGGYIAGDTARGQGLKAVLQRGGAGMLAGGAAGAGLGALVRHLQKEDLRQQAERESLDMQKTSAVESYLRLLEKIAAADYKGMVGGAMLGSLAGLPLPMGAALGARLHSGRGHGLGAAVADLKNAKRKKTAAEETEKVDPRHPALRGMSRGIGRGALVGGGAGAGLGALLAGLVTREPASALAGGLQGGLQGATAGGMLGGGIGALSGLNKEKKDAWHAAMKAREAQPTEKTSAFEAYRALLQRKV